MKQEILLIGSDLRQSKLVSRLQAQGWIVRCHQVAQHPDDFFISSSFADVAAVLLPIPALASDGMIRGTDAPGIPFSSLLHTVPKDIPILGGLLPDCPKDSRLVDLAKDPAFAMENASLTAEGAIRILMERMPPIHGRCILITGFGRIGAFLAYRLKGLGAAVTIRVRRPEMQLQCALSGFAVDQGNLQDCDIVINTVPAPVLTAQDLERLRPDCLILELASSPGGLEPGITPKQLYLKAPGVPIRYAPEQAADVLLRTVLRVMKERRIG